MIHLPKFSRDIADSIRPLRSIALRDDSKTRMREALSAFADLHTVTAPMPEATVSPLSAFFSRTRGLYASALMLTLMVAGGTQASIAAEGALPGDALYALKVSVSEPMALALSLTPARKAELSAEFAARRVSEAATLASRDRLNTERADELAARFDTHVDTLERETVALESKGELGVSLVVRADLSQKVSEQTGEIAASAPAAASMLLSDEAPEARFSARVSEKSKQLATTRERLDAALASDASANLSSIVANRPGDPQLFFATLGLHTATTSTSTATSTATTTPPFLTPFFNRGSSSNR